VNYSKLREEILNRGIIPEHIAIIMDGNGRWAKQRSMPRLAGHHEGINSVREITRVCGEIGVKHLTLYTFSTENWQRPQREVSALMKLLLNTIRDEVKSLHKNKVKLTTIGDLNALPDSARKGILEGIELTEDNTGLNLVLALNYGSRQELIMAVNKIMDQIDSGEVKPEQISEQTISNNLYTNNIKDPDLLIRTGGEHRISNFLLWQSAYSELYMTDTYWPEFREEQLLTAIHEFQNRERRFGKISKQVQTA
jgi:undecaprenyl diphosphate synthase|tara:strand:+ start:662 stop:1420 length:759 start_codon:yes stop_codon:yes gene_type:complete